MKNNSDQKTPNAKKNTKSTQGAMPKNTLIIVIDLEQENNTVAADILKHCQTLNDIRKIWLSVLDETSAQKTLSDILSECLKTKTDCNCPNCHKPLRRLKSPKNGGFFWGCSGFPHCGFSTDDDNNAPKLSCDAPKIPLKLPKPKKQTLPPNHQQAWDVPQQLQGLIDNKTGLKTGGPTGV